MKTYKLTKEDKELIKKAKEIIVKSRPVNLIDTGDVGSALMTSKGNIFQGVCIGHYCGIGSCGEYQAIGAMISNGEKIIKKIVAVWYDEKRKRYGVNQVMFSLFFGGDDETWHTKKDEKVYFRKFVVKGK